MEKKEKSSSIQSIIITSVILLILTYISADVLVFRPSYNQRVQIVEKKYDSLNIYLQEKLPEFEYQLDNQLKKIYEQEKAIQTISNILGPEENINVDF